MRIGIDLDDTVMDFVPEFLREAKHLYGLEYRISDVNDYLLASLPGLNPERVTTIMQSMISNEALAKLKPVEGSVYGLNNLRNNGHAITYITNRTPTPSTMRQARFWMEWHGIKHPIIYSKNKGQDLERIRADLLLDDNPRNIISAIEHGIKAFVFDRPWNTTMPEVYKRVNGWYDFIERVRELDMEDKR